MKKIIIATLCLLPSLAFAQGWTPLSSEEIADAHTCTGGGEIMICAGEKKILTGLSLNQATYGAQLIGPLGKIESYKYDGCDKGFSVTAEVSIKQQDPSWKAAYYVISDKELNCIVEKARREPEWKP